MKRSIYIFAGLSLFAFTGSQQITADEAKTELEGTWELVSMERDGKELKLLMDARTIITGDRFVFKVGDVVDSSGTMKLNPTRKPKAVDIIYNEGRTKGKTYKGIYEINGDMAKVCRPRSPDADRPIEFKTKPGSDCETFVYKRLKS